MTDRYLRRLGCTGESPANQWNLDEIATKENQPGPECASASCRMDKSITNRGREYTPTNDLSRARGRAWRISI
jgi:hypothetical protein